MLGFLAHGILGVTGGLIGVTEVTAKQVGVELFGPYVLAVELASILLLAGLVTAYHLGREDKSGEVLSVPKASADKISLIIPVFNEAPLPPPNQRSPPTVRCRV